MIGLYFFHPKHNGLYATKKLFFPNIKLQNAAIYTEV